MLLYKKLLLMTFSTILVHYLWVEGVPGGQINQRMCAQYEDNALSCRVVYEWIEIFKNSCTSVTDAECSVTATTAQNEEGARELFLQTEECWFTKLQNN
jgi:hypothetical protein